MLTYADLGVRVRFRSPGRLPVYPGATIRGAFGYCLKHVVCHVRQRDCDRCLLVSRCAYPALFEGCPGTQRAILRKYARVPQPFVLRLPASTPTRVDEGDAFEFGIRLFGVAADLYPYVVLALAEAGARGLGFDRALFDLQIIGDGDALLFDSANPGDIERPSVQRMGQDHLTTEHDLATLCLEFVTPLRLRTDGELNPTPAFDDVVRSALRRLKVLSYFYGDGEQEQLDVAAIHRAATEVAVIGSRLRPVTIARFSTRQRQTVPLRGTFGYLTVRGVRPVLLDLLQRASICHVGKATSFGFGRLELKAQDT